MLDFKIEYPKNLQNEFLLKLKKFILLGKNVHERGLKGRLVASHRIAYCTDDDELVGICCIKNPNKSYLSKIEKNYTYSFSNKVVEIGYSFVLNSHRGKGINSKLKDMLLEKIDETIFCTTSNPISAGSLLRRGFVQIGNPVDGVYSKKISLYIKQQSK